MTGAPQSTSSAHRSANFCHRHPFFLAFILYIVLIGIIVGVAYPSFNQDMNFTFVQIPFNKSGIALIGRSYQLDVNSQILSIEWEVVGCGDYRLSTDPWAAIQSGHYVLGCGACGREVDIYVNSVSKPAFSYNPANIPLSMGNVSLYAYNLNALTVDHSLGGFSQSVAPFDTHLLTATAFVIEKATNRSVPIIAFAAGEGPSNFVVSSNVVSWARSNYTYDPGTGPTTVEAESSVIVIKLKKSQLTRAFTVCLLLINLALAVGSVYVTVLVLTRRERIHEGVLLFPVTVVLTIPALRNLYPGSAPFGIYIDTFGFFTPMMIVALCSMILLYVVARPSTPVRLASHDSGDA